MESKEFNMKSRKVTALIFNSNPFHERCTPMYTKIHGITTGMSSYVGSNNNLHKYMSGNR
jgi:hypothetical protein